MNEIIITIPGVPIAQRRPRFARRGKYVVTYSDQETEAGRWLLTARQQITEKIPAEVPIVLSCFFYMPIPKSMSKKKQALLKYHIKTPDISNLVKFLEDCLNGELWHDDSQISEILTRKVYSDEPRTVICATWGDEEV